jgi:hypothetical protein
MEAETPRKRRSWRWWLYIPGGLFVVFTAYYTVMALISSSNKIADINRVYGYRQDEKNPIDKRIFNDSAFIMLNREKAYYNSRNLLAESDSIYLSLNLHDSAAFLEINGVTVHTARLDRISVCKALQKADEYAVSSLLSVPFVIMENHANLLKEPLMLKIAPKDTSEYKPDIVPDTTNAPPVNYMMEMDNGFRLYIYQDVEAGGTFNRFKFDMHDRFARILDILRKIIVFKVPDYHPSIRITVKKSDARTIYRALPVHGQIAVYR